MILLFLIFYLFCIQNIISSDNQDIHIEDYTKQLDKNNFNETINQHNDVLVLFHVNSDEQSSNLLTVFKEAAFNTKDLGYEILFATVDMANSLNETIWDVEEIPKIFHYSEGQRFKYREENSAKGIYNFINQEFSKNFTQFYLNESLIIDNHTLSSEKNKSIVLYVGDPYNYPKAFTEIKRVMEGFTNSISFFWTNQSVFMNTFNVPNDGFALVSFFYLPSKTSFNNATILETYDKKSLIMNLTLLSKDLFENLNENSIEKIIDNGIPSLIFIYGNENKDANNNGLDNLINEFTPVVENYRNQYWSLKLDINNTEMQEFFEMFSINNHNLPTAIIISINPNNEEEIMKYKFDNNNKSLTRQSLIDFIENSKNGTLKQYETSESVPENPVNQHGVYRIVGNNFRDYLKIDKNIVLLVCTDDPKDENCVQVRNRFDSISNRFNASTNLSFAFFEPIKNPNNIVNLQYVPDIFIFPNENDKFSKMKMFAGNYTTNEIIQFIQSSVTNCQLIESSQTNQEEEQIKKEPLISRRKINEEEEEEDDEEMNEDEMSDDIENEETNEQEQGHTDESSTEPETSMKGNKHIDL